MPLSRAAQSRYLRLLGLSDLQPGVDGLRAVLRRHIQRVPFENISKLLLIGREGRGRVTALDEFLDGIEHYDLGGTCYTSNPFLATLLESLGYDVDLLGADMSKANVHTSIRVRIDGAAYHVDAGFGAPFFDPMLLDRLPHKISWGEYRYCFNRTTDQDTFELKSTFGGEPSVGYRVHGPERSREFFEPIILDSFRPGQTFVGMLRIVRYFEDHSVELSNATLTRHRGLAGASTTLTSLRELRSAVSDEFAMPRAPIDEAVDVLRRVSAKLLF